MEIKQQNKLLIITLIILLSINGAIVSAIWINKSKMVRLNKTEQKNNNQYKRKNKTKNAFFQNLNLTQKQTVEANSMRKEHFGKMKDMKNSIRTNKQKIHDELFKTSPDTNHIMQLADTIGLLNAEMEKLNYEHFMELKEILDPEQQIIFKQIIDDASFRDKYHKRNDSRKQKHYKNRN